MMKRLLTLMITGFALASQGQITLEHTYSYAGVSTATVSDSSFIYYHVDSMNVYLFSPAHQQIKTVSHGSSGYPLVYSVSQTLFDSDAGYEFIVNTFNTNGNTFEVMNDDGTTLLSGSGLAYVNKAGKSAKLIVRTDTQSKVYSLPGQVHTSRIAESGLTTHDAYPNPSSSWVRLPYDLNDAHGNLKIIDMAGRVQKTYSISGMFKDIRIEPGTLPAGQYLYYIESKGQRSDAKPFIIN